MQVNLDTNRVALLERIKEKGGMPGKAAGIYLNDESEGNELIRLLFEQCRQRDMWDCLGRELVLDLVKYRIRYLRNQYHEIYVQ